jgi:hypothetical protein
MEMTVKTKEPRVEKSPNPIPELTASKDVAKVRDELAATYDMFVSDQFAADLIRFVEEMTREPRG